MPSFQIDSAWLRAMDQAAQMRAQRDEARNEVERLRGQATSLQGTLIRADQWRVENERLRELVEFVLACEGNDYSVGDAWIARAEDVLGKEA